MTPLASSVCGPAGLRRAVFAVVASAGVMISPLAAVGETLADALISAYRHSSLLDQNRAVLRAADEDVAASVAALRPVVDFVASAAWNRPVLQPFGNELSATLALSAEITLFDFGRNQLRIDATKELVMATRQSLVGVEHRVLLSAVQSYMDVRLAEDTVVLRQSNVRVIGRELGAARDRFELGEITRTDVAIAEARLAGARSNLASAEGDLAIARENYKLAVGRYPGRLAVPPRAPQTARTLDEAKSIARRTHYAIKQAQHEVQVAEINIARADASMKPNITANAQLGQRVDGGDTASVGLRFTQRLYQGGGLSALYRQAVARRDASRAGLHRTAAEVEQGVGQAWAQLAVARASIEASDRQVRAARTAYDGVREEATLGARTTLDVLNAEQELLDAQAGRLRAVTGQYTATYALLAAMGLLTVDHLRLGIPTYDPSAYFNAVKSAPATSSQGKRLDRVLKSIGQ